MDPKDEAGQEQEVKDEFGDAFEAASQEKTAEELEAEARETGRAKEKETDFPEGELPEGQTEKDKAGEEKAATGAGEEPPDYKKLYEDEHQRYSSLQGMHNQTQEELATLKKATPAPKEEPLDQKKDEISAEELLTTLGLNEDEDVKGFVEEYDYLAKPLQKIVAKAVQLSKSQAPDASPAEIAKQVLETINRQIHTDSIKTAHADYEDLRDNGELKTYVESLPDGDDKTRLTGYYQKGTADEVVSLVDSYKESKGIKVTPKADQARDAKITNLTAVKSKKTPIDASKRTAKAESYEDAFDEAVVAGRKR